MELQKIIQCNSVLFYNYYQLNNSVKYMLKYVNYDIVFQEFPDEVTLAINISNCPCKCPGCHSLYLTNDIGSLLTIDKIDNLINQHKKTITCIGLMGGDINPTEINAIAKYIKQKYRTIKIGWYTGRTTISRQIDIKFFNYIKVGPYIKHLGPINSKTTNQKMYRVENESILNDITNRFWKNN